MSELPAAEFIEIDADAIIADSVSYFERLTGRKLSPGQAEMLLIQGFSYREYLLRVQANEAARQNLLSYARYPMLDYLGELVGTIRLPASSTRTIIRFTMVEGHPALTIPESIRVQSTDGKVVFLTLESASVGVGNNTVEVTAECTTPGEAGNDYEIGDISIILDPQAFVISASNIAVTSGGADQESDDDLRERIKLAPSAFSSAGPDDAYKYFAKSAHPGIVDVGIGSVAPGHVNIYPLMKDGELPDQSVLDLVSAKTSPKKVRPLNDIVEVSAPSRVEYSINVELTLYTGAIVSSTVAKVTELLNNFASERRSRLAMDVVISRIVAISMLEDLVYDVNVVSPADDIVIDDSQVAYCTGVQVTVTGFSEE